MLQIYHEFWTKQHLVHLCTKTETLKLLYSVTVQKVLLHRQVKYPVSCFKKPGRKNNTLQAKKKTLKFMKI